MVRRAPVVLAATVARAGGLVLAGPAGGADAATGYAAALARAPYVTDLVGLHVAVNFATDRSGTSASIRWGAVNVAFDDAGFDTARLGAGS